MNAQHISRSARTYKTIHNTQKGPLSAKTQPHHRANSSSSFMNRDTCGHAHQPTSEESIWRRGPATWHCCVCVLFNCQSDRWQLMVMLEQGACAQTGRVRKALEARSRVNTWKVEGVSWVLVVWSVCGIDQSMVWMFECIVFN